MTRDDTKTGTASTAETSLAAALDEVRQRFVTIPIRHELPDRNRRQQGRAVYQYLVDAPGVGQAVSRLVVETPQRFGLLTGLVCLLVMWYAEFPLDLYLRIVGLHPMRTVRSLLDPVVVEFVASLLASWEGSERTLGLAGEVLELDLAFLLGILIGNAVWHLGRTKAPPLSDRRLVVEITSAGEGTPELSYRELGGDDSSLESILENLYAGQVELQVTDDSYRAALALSSTEPPETTIHTLECRMSEQRPGDGVLPLATRVTETDDLTAQDAALAGLYDHVTDCGIPIVVQVTVSARTDTQRVSQAYDERLNDAVRDVGSQVTADRDEPGSRHTPRPGVKSLREASLPRELRERRKRFAAVDRNHLFDINVRALAVTTAADEATAERILGRIPEIIDTETTEFVDVRGEYTAVSTANVSKRLSRDARRVRAVIERLDTGAVAHTPCYRLSPVWQADERPNITFDAPALARLLVVPGVGRTRAGGTRPRDQATPRRPSEDQLEYLRGDPDRLSESLSSPGGSRETSNSGKSSREASRESAGDGGGRLRRTYRRLRRMLPGFDTDE